jgi:hypothetical protein
MEITSYDVRERVGQTLGRQLLHYRGAEWFGVINLMLQEERMVRVPHSARSA